MPKAVILYSFTKGDTSTLQDNLPRLGFKRTEGRRVVFSTSFDVSEVKLTAAQMATIKDTIKRKATVMISSPENVWKEAFKAARIPGDQAILLAGLATAEPPAANVVVSEDEMSQESQGPPAEWGGEEAKVVDDEEDVDELARLLAGSALGGRRRTRKRKGKRGTRRHRRRV